jgi:hypothetical protein
VASAVIALMWWMPFRGFMCRTFQLGPVLDLFQAVTEGLFHA